MESGQAMKNQTSGTKQANTPTQWTHLSSERPGVFVRSETNKATTPAPAVMKTAGMARNDPSGSP